MLYVLACTCCLISECNSWRLQRSVAPVKTLLKGKASQICLHPLICMKLTQCCKQPTGKGFTLL